MISKKKEQKYAIDEELQPYCHSIPKLPKTIMPLLQSAMRRMGRKMLKDDRLDCMTFELEHDVELVMLKPKSSCTRKAVYDIHGGGFVFPHAPYHIELAKEYALRLDAKVFLIDYRLAPKHQYPIAPDDCFMGYEFLLKNQDMLGIDIENLVVGGDSAGGYLAVSVSLQMHQKYGHVPKGNFLIYPACDTSKDTQSMLKYTDTPLCNSRDAEIYDTWFNNGDIITVMNEDLSVLPETYMEVAEFDCLRDCGLSYANRLKQAGIKVELHDVPATMHGFDNAVNARITRSCVDNRIRFIQTLFRPYDTVSSPSDTEA